METIQNPDNWSFAANIFTVILSLFGMVILISGWLVWIPNQMRQKTKYYSGELERRFSGFNEKPHTTPCYKVKHSKIHGGAIMAISDEYNQFFTGDFFYAETELVPQEGKDDYIEARCVAAFRFNLIIDHVWSLFIKGYSGTLYLVPQNSIGFDAYEDIPNLLGTYKYRHYPIKQTIHLKLKSQQVNDNIKLPINITLEANENGYSRKWDHVIKFVFTPHPQIIEKL